MIFLAVHAGNESLVRAVAHHFTDRPVGDRLSVVFGGYSVELAMCDHADNKDLPLCVDLDGTLINTDLLMESLFALLRQSPLSIFLVPFWLLRGKAYLKEQIVRRVQIDVTILPYHAEFLAYLFEWRANGRQLVLATASHLRFAEQVAAHLGIFESVLATEGGKNLSRSRKGDCLARLYGEGGFDYAGNSRADLAVWIRARSAILVNPVPGIQRKVRRQTPIIAIFDDRNRLFAVYFRALCLPEWIKNLAIFLPLLAIPQDENLSMLIRDGLAFLSFGLFTTSACLLSDLLQLPNDRREPYKRFSALAAGTMSIIHGAVMVPMLFAIATIIAFLLSAKYLVVLVGYYILALAYFMLLKQQTMRDILLETVLYAVRIIAGWIVVGAQFPLW